MISVARAIIDVRIDADLPLLIQCKTSFLFHSPQTGGLDLLFHSHSET